MDGRRCVFHVELLSSFRLYCKMTGLLLEQFLEHDGVRSCGVGSVSPLGIGWSPSGSILEMELSGGGWAPKKSQV